MEYYKIVLNFTKMEKNQLFKFYNNELFEINNDPFELYDEKEKVILKEIIYKEEQQKLIDKVIQYYENIKNNLNSKIKYNANIKQLIGHPMGCMIMTYNCFGNIHLQEILDELYNK